MYGGRNDPPTEEFAAADKKVTGGEKISWEKKDLC